MAKDIFFFNLYSAISIKSSKYKSLFAAVFTLYNVSRVAVGGNYFLTYANYLFRECHITHIKILKILLLFVNI